MNLATALRIGYYANLLLVFCLRLLLKCFCKLSFKNIMMMMIMMMISG